MTDGPLLALDASTDVGSVAVGDGGRLLAETVLRVGAGHSSALLPAIDGALAAAGLAPRDLGGVVAAGGPGSFTGIRIGAATAKGLVAALGVPLFAFSGLLMCAASHWTAERPVCALFDARRRDVYAGCWRFGADGEVEELLAPAATSLDALPERLAGAEAPLFTGPAALLHREELEADGRLVAPGPLAVPRASALLVLAAAMPEAGRVADPAAWEPEYLRASGAERIAAAAGRG